MDFLATINTSGITSTTALIAVAGVAAIGAGKMKELGDEINEMKKDDPRPIINQNSLNIDRLGKKFDAMLNKQTQILRGLEIVNQQVSLLSGLTGKTNLQFNQLQANFQTLFRASQSVVSNPTASNPTVSNPTVSNSVGGKAMPGKQMSGTSKSSSAPPQPAKSAPVVVKKSKKAAPVKKPFLSKSLFSGFDRKLAFKGFENLDEEKEKSEPEEPVVTERKKIRESDAEFPVLDDGGVDQFFDYQ